MYLIYKITNPQTELSYVGWTKDLPRRIAEHKYYNTIDCQDFIVEVLFENIPSIPEAEEMEKVFIYIHNTFKSGYNKTRGGSGGTEVSEETKQKQSEAALRRVANRTNPFCDSDAARERALQRVADGTHPWQGPEHNQKRLEDGTHNLLGKNNPIHERTKNGTNPFLGGEIQRETNRKRWTKYRKRQRETIIILAQVLYYIKPVQLTLF